MEVKTHLREAAQREREITALANNPQVVLPLVSNGRNHRLWPQVVSQDVLRHTGGLKGDVLTLSGQVKGKTLLPLPPQAESAAMAAADIEAGLGPSQKHVVHVVESVVIEWCHQVRDVLKRSSAQPLLDGLHPGPLAEVTFWKERCLDMESIVDQLSTPKVRKMCVLLERTISSYYPAFVAMLESVDAALREARDISMHLKPLQRQFEELEAGDFLALPLRFPALFHTVCLVWAHSTHYWQPARLVVLLQEACNLLIELRQWYWL